ncbi:MAG: hypothetical protein AAB570_01110 [Patescibacteria group bacterium]
MTSNTLTYQCTLFKREFTPHILGIAMRESRLVVACVPTKHAAESVHRAAQQYGLRTQRIHANRSRVQERRAFDACAFRALDLLVVTPRVFQNSRINQPHVVIFSGTATPSLVMITAKSAPSHILILRTEYEEKNMRAIERSYGICVPSVSLHGYATMPPYTTRHPWTWLRRHRMLSPWQWLFCKEEILT